eukprot:TRINITY_DN12170_c0_g1_i10.p2 TRINITY_DN12170_c0_g1~~TRINITY_DN12170_c0_g1_i10.p2  ORF type:complete len:251 (+),score=41.21 TRINITY_DN12170_c0_g1_i10:998-1750(+)
MIMNNSVFVRDTPHNLFLYGTTDIIVGTVSGRNMVINTDFNQRGEFSGGPDGCALDFETSATGFSVTGCTFYRSYGAGIMVFGHATTSHNLLIADNQFQNAGCIQPRDDQGGIGFMCPADQHPTATVANNRFWACNNTQAMHDRIPSCSDNVIKTNNTINQDEFVLAPTINLDPVAPTDNEPHPTMTLTASTITPNATIRYTFDGSRPTPDLPSLARHRSEDCLPRSRYGVQRPRFPYGHVTLRHQHHDC